MRVPRCVQLHRSPVPLLPTTAPVHGRRRPHQSLPHKQTDRGGPKTPASCNCAVVGPVLTSGQGQVAGRHRNRGRDRHRTSPNSLLAAVTQATPSQPGSPPSHLGNHARRVRSGRLLPKVWRKRLRATPAPLLCARAVPQHTPTRTPGAVVANPHPTEPMESLSSPRPSFLRPPAPSTRLA